MSKTTLPPEELKELREVYAKAPGKTWDCSAFSELVCELGALGKIGTCEAVQEFVCVAHNKFPALLSAAEENAALKQQLSASEWIRKDNALRTYDGLTEQLAESRARVAELEADANEMAPELSRLLIENTQRKARVARLEEALGNILLSHDGRCVLICDDQNPFGKWDCVEECTDRIVRKARSRAEAKEKP